jgi:dihydrofolate reductase
MGRTVFYTATTLDGYLADEHDSLDWLFKQDNDPEGPLGYEPFIRGAGAMAMGATTYQWVLDRNARTGDAWGYEIPCWIFTHRDLTPVTDDVVITTDPVVDVHARMVAAAGGPTGKDLWVVGGGDLAAQFAEHGLLDEVVVSIAPVTLGAGRPLFPRRFDFELLEHARNGGFLCARYAVQGPLAVATSDEGPAVVAGSLDT